jgi:hypothetical protein
LDAFNGIIKQLESQKAAIDKALTALKGLGGEEEAPTAVVDGENKRSAAQKARWAAKKAAESAPAKRKGGMTPEGRASLVAALKKRHADRKAALETPAAEKPVKATRRSGISAAGRKALAEAMKRRWAAKRTGAQAKKRGKKKAA